MIKEELDYRRFSFLFGLTFLFMFGKKEEPQIEEKYYKIISTMRISSISDEANKMIAE